MVAPRRPARAEVVGSLLRPPLLSQSIDAFYERKVKFICSAAAPPERLYVDGDGAFEFQRTVSRLMEMQSPEYLALDHIEAA